MLVNSATHLSDCQSLGSSLALSLSSPSSFTSPVSPAPATMIGQVRSLLARICTSDLATTAVSTLAVRTATVTASKVRPASATTTELRHDTSYR